jgi:WD40 repeat protein
LEGPTVSIYSVDFSPDGKYALGGCSDKTLKLWDISTGKEIRTFKGHSDWVRSVAFSPDGKYALSGSDDGSIKLWEVSTGKKVKTFNWHNTDVYSVAFSPDGKKIVSSGRDYTIMDKFRRVPVGEHTIKVGDISDGKVKITFKGHSNRIWSVAFSPDSKYILSGSSDRTMKLWDISTEKESATFRNHSDGISSVVFSKTGLYAFSGSWDNTLKLWEISTKSEMRTFMGHSEGALSVMLTPDYKYAMSGSRDGTTRIWNIATGKEIAQFIEFKDGEWVVITPEGYYNVSEKGDTYLSVLPLPLGNVDYGMGEYRSTFFKPEVVAAALRLGDTERAVAEVLGGEKEKPVVTAVKEPVKGKQEVTEVKIPSPQETIEPPKVPHEVVSEVKEENPPVIPDVKKEVPPIMKPPKPKDTTPPKITILSPEIGKEDKVVSKTSRMTIQGKAIDESGVAEVTVNGEVIDLDENGNFSADVLLKVGENEIHVTAIDIYKNQATHSFKVLREGRKIVASKAPPLMEVKGKYYSLIIGINDYKYIQKLETAKKDAAEVERLLRERYGFETKLIINATRMDILNTINDFRKKLKEEDNLLIYYAGHGDYDKITDKAYWLPVDAERDNPANWIMSDDITTNIRRIVSKHILIVSDSCYSGTFVRRVVTDLSVVKSDREGFIKRMIEKTSRTLMASGGNEPVLDVGGSGHSIFAEAFLKGLKEVDENVFTADELFYGMIRERVIGKADQTPQYNNIRNSGHEGGDFVFIKK